MEKITVYPEMSIDWVLGTLDLWLESLEFPEIMRLNYKCNHDGIVEAAKEMWPVRKLREFIFKKMNDGETNIHLILDDFYWYMLKQYNETSVLSSMKSVYSSAADLPNGIYEDWDVSCQEGDWL